MESEFNTKGDGIYPVEERERTRVGDPDSVVLPGDINPENSMPYRAGQFAPSVEDLTEDVLRAADDAGLLPNTLPIYDEGGAFSLELLDAWDPGSDLRERGINMDPEAPKYVSAITLAALDNAGDIPRKVNLSGISVPPREAIQGRAYGVIIVAARYSTANGKFTGGLEIYPDFYRYIGVPLSPRVPGRATGVSVASYAILHAIGHLYYSRLVSVGDLAAVSRVLGSTWLKDKSLPVQQYEDANFLGAPLPGSRLWKRRRTSLGVSELSKASPGDDFAETFALYMTNRDYLAKLFPKKFEAMQGLVGDEDVL